jgi:hypothetical protein
MECIGQSREGRPIHAYMSGAGPLRINLIGGCHADEPVGPRFLLHLSGFLDQLVPDHPARTRFRWTIVPHVNPDGDQRNQSWIQGHPDTYDPIAYLHDRTREQPGDDIEFGFPYDISDDGTRPENRAAFEWWRSLAPFHLHLSLHGMGFGTGPWFLVEPGWIYRLPPLMRRCRERVAELGYCLHDVDRAGEKGFWRLGPGFSTRPDSAAMRMHFFERGEKEVAERFRPSSMETIRSFGGDPFTAVTEMPLFIHPGGAESLPDSTRMMQEWQNRISDWTDRLLTLSQHETREIRDEMKQCGLYAMPILDQMHLQWQLIVSGIDMVEQRIFSGDRSRGR